MFMLLFFSGLLFFQKYNTHTQNETETTFDEFSMGQE